MAWAQRIASFGVLQRRRLGWYQSSFEVELARLRALASATDPVATGAVEDAGDLLNRSRTQLQQNDLDGGWQNPWWRR